MENYRKIYESQCNIKIPKGYVIHHIDFDRTNNNIRNLVMIPSDLHKEYHELKNLMSIVDIHLELTSLLDRGNGINTYALFNIEKFVKTYEECCKYVDYRDYLLGLLPNIHRMNIGEKWNK